MIGRGNNKPSLSATPPCATSHLAGRHPYHTIFLIVFPFAPDPLLLGDSGAHWPRQATHHRQRHHPARPSTDSATPARPAAPGETRGLFVERWAYSHVRTAVHAPLGHAGLPFDSFLPPRHHAHFANARKFLLVDWYEHLHPVVALPLSEVSSTKKIAADGPVARHLDASTRRARHCRQRRLLRPPPGHASR